MSLTPKGRKTPITNKPLHVCSSTPVTGVTEKLEIDRRGRKQKSIWNTNEFPYPSNVTIKNKKLIDPGEEFKRMKSTQYLSKKFFTIVQKQTQKVPPIMCFERWLLNSKLNEQNLNLNKDLYEPVLPESKMIDKELVSDLIRISITKNEANKIASQLAIESLELVKKIREEPINNSKINVIQHKYTLDINYENKLLKINDSHYKKLKIQFFRYGLTEKQKKNGENDENNILLFHQALFVMLARYHSIQGHGYQAACNEKFFEILHEYFDVSFECFASPLNSYFNHYCSAFIDTDWCFGAVSNFFNFFPKEGSFECNPPFIPSIMLKTVEHIDFLFKNTDDDKNYLNFIVIVPGWLDDPAICALDCSIWNKKKISISKDEHGFCDGAQHQRKDRFRESPFDTFIYILQNDIAETKFPITNEIELDIRKAMAMAIPTDAMKERRLKEGRGFADADGGGGVYKGKKKRKNDNEKKNPPLKRRKM